MFAAPFFCRHNFSLAMTFFRLSHNLPPPSPFLPCMFLPASLVTIWSLVVVDSYVDIVALSLSCQRSYISGRVSMGSHQKGGPAPPLGSYHSGGYDSIRLFAAVGHIIGTCLPHIYSRWWELGGGASKQFDWEQLVPKLMKYRVLAWNIQREAWKSDL